MAYVIGDECVSCGACAGGCPAGAISEGDCIDCGACAGTCPSGAITEG